MRERNKDVSTNSISNWLRRNPKVTQKLKDFIKGHVDQPKNLEVDLSIYDNGNFQKIESVETWINEMYDRELSPKTINSFVSTIKKICKGEFKRWKINLIESGEWVFKHPDRLTVEEYKDLNRILQRDYKKDTSSLRLAVRNFLESKGEHVGKKISGRKSKGFGKHADLFVEMTRINKMLNYVKTINYVVFTGNLFMFKTATRIESTLQTKIEDFRKLDFTIRVTDKGRHSKGRKTWRKYIDPQLRPHFLRMIGERKTGYIFTLPNKSQKALKDVFSKLNRESLDRFCPELKKLRMINHFWRHMFAQHMLRLTNWNYGVVANLGGWTVQALEESYGRPPSSIVKEWGLEWLGKLDVGTVE